MFKYVFSVLMPNRWFDSSKCNLLLKKVKELPFKKRKEITSLTKEIFFTIDVSELNRIKIRLLFFVRTVNTFIHLVSSVHLTSFCKFWTQPNVVLTPIVYLSASWENNCCSGFFFLNIRTCFSFTVICVTFLT